MTININSLSPGDIEFNQLFGVGASQNQNSITVSKIDLASVGLTPTANNTAESLMVALILMWANYFNGGNIISPDSNSIVDDSGNNLIYANDTKKHLHLFYWRTIRIEINWVFQFVIHVYD